MFGLMPIDLAAAVPASERLVVAVRLVAPGFAALCAGGMAVGFGTGVVLAAGCAVVEGIAHALGVAQLAVFADGRAMLGAAVVHLAAARAKVAGCVHRGAGNAFRRPHAQSQPAAREMASEAMLSEAMRKACVPLSSAMMVPPRLTSRPLPFPPRRKARLVALPLSVRAGSSWETAAQNPAKRVSYVPLSGAKALKACVPSPAPSRAYVCVPASSKQIKRKRSCGLAVVSANAAVEKRNIAAKTAASNFFMRMHLPNFG